MSLLTDVGCVRRDDEDDAELDASVKGGGSFSNGTRFDEDAESELPAVAMAVDAVEVAAIAILMRVDG